MSLDFKLVIVRSARWKQSRANEGCAKIYHGFTPASIFDACNLDTAATACCKASGCKIKPAWSMQSNSFTPINPGLTEKTSAKCYA